MVTGDNRLILNVALCTVVFLLPREVFAQQPPKSDWSIKILHSIGDENQAHTDTIKNVLLRNQDRQILTCGLDGVVCLWDVQSKSIIRRFVDIDSQIVWCMDMTSNERYLVAGGKRNQISVWDIDSGELISKHSCASTVRL
jgi:WD40 repeat protein